MMSKHWHVTGSHKSTLQTDDVKTLTCVTGSHKSTLQTDDVKTLTCDWIPQIYSTDWWCQNTDMWLDPTNPLYRLMMSKHWHVWLDPTNPLYRLMMSKHWHVWLDPTNPLYRLMMSKHWHVWLDPTNPLYRLMMSKHWHVTGSHKSTLQTDDVKTLTCDWIPQIHSTDWWCQNTDMCDWIPQIHSTDWWCQNTDMCDWIPQIHSTDWWCQNTDMWLDPTNPLYRLMMSKHWHVTGSHKSTLQTDDVKTLTCDWIPQIHSTDWWCQNTDMCDWIPQIHSTDWWCQNTDMWLDPTNPLYRLMMSKHWHVTGSHKSTLQTDDVKTLTCDWIPQIHSTDWWCQNTDMWLDPTNPLYRLMMSKHWHVTGSHKSTLQTDDVKTLTCDWIPQIHSTDWWCQNTDMWLDPTNPLYRLMMSKHWHVWLDPTNLLYRLMMSKHWHVTGSHKSTLQTDDVKTLTCDWIPQIHSTDWWCQNTDMWLDATNPLYRLMMSKHWHVTGSHKSTLQTDDVKTLTCDWIPQIHSTDWWCQNTDMCDWIPQIHSTDWWCQNTDMCIFDGMFYIDWIPQIHSTDWWCQNTDMCIFDGMFYIDWIPQIHSTDWWCQNTDMCIFDGMFYIDRLLLNWGLSKDEIDLRDHFRIPYDVFLSSLVRSLKLQDWML